MDISDILLQLGSLFLSAFFAATILPAQSEIVLAVLHASQQYNVWLLVLVATTGNVLGAVVNWLLGRYLIHFQDRPWFPISHTSLKKAEVFYHKYGVWTLLLAWVPFIGDPLTMIAGILRVHIVLFLVLVTIGKCLRYAGLVTFI